MTLKKEHESWNCHRPGRSRQVLLFVVVVLMLAGCLPAPSSPTVAPLTPSPTVTSSPAPTTQPATPSPEPDLVVQVDAMQPGHAISPLIYGLSGAPADVQQALRPTLTSWGGNPSTRFNWQIGHAWNAGRDWFFRNGNYGFKEGSASDSFISGAAANGMAVRLAVPTLGWVAKDDNNNTCSFPTPSGGCSDVREAKCDNQTVIADPNRANVPSTAASIQDWMRHLFVEQGYRVRFLAMDNEPELWGYTHYDVHPDCTTYQEILDKLLEYASAVRAVAPDAEITGPVTCCWYFYWNSAAGDADKQKHDGQDFLPWFLDQVRQHDQASGTQLLNVLDIHYYPEGLYNQNVDPQTAAHRLRSTRSLWDPTYVDESWIHTPVYLIPRMQSLIDQHYPGLRLMISEWNWGADKDINGALAIADVLGIYGRENLYAASYWTYPPIDSPGFYAFKMYTNYDDQGGRFGGADGGSVIQASSDNPEWVTCYAAMSTSGKQTYLMLINKDPEKAASAKIVISGFSFQSQMDVYRYESADLQGITHDQIDIQPGDVRITLPGYSISLLVLTRAP